MDGTKALAKAPGLLYPLNCSKGGEERGAKGGRDFPGGGKKDYWGA